MKIETSHIDSFTYIRLIGDENKEINSQEIDFDVFENKFQKNNDKILDTLDNEIKEGHTTIILNLVQAKYIDSGGLGVLVRSLHKVENAGGKLYLIAPHESIRKTIEMVGLKKVLQVYENEEEFDREIRQIN